VLAAIWLGSCYALVYYVPYARGYTLSVLLTLILSDFLFNKPPELTRRQRRGSFALSFLLVLTLPTMLLLIIAVLAWRWRVSRRSWLEHYALPLGMGAACALPFYAYGLVTPFLREQTLGITLPELSAELLAAYGGVGMAALVVGGGALWRGGQSALSSLSRWVIGTALGLGLLQLFLTQRMPFLRNYTYWLPFFVLSAANWLGTRLRWRGVLLLATGLWLVGLWDSRPLNQPTEVDRFLAVLARHLQPTDVLMVNCCLDIPTQYQYRQQPGLYDITPAKTRLVLIPTALSSIEQLLQTYDLPLNFLDQCRPARWDDYAVYLCALTGIHGR
jgi:hypothetical protein